MNEVNISFSFNPAYLLVWVSTLLAVATAFATVYFFPPATLRRYRSLLLISGGIAGAAALLAVVTQVPFARFAAMGFLNLICAIVVGFTCVILFWMMGGAIVMIMNRILPERDEDISRDLFDGLGENGSADVVCALLGATVTAVSVATVILCFGNDAAGFGALIFPAVFTAWMAIMVDSKDEDTSSDIGDDSDNGGDDGKTGARVNNFA